MMLNSLVRDLRNSDSFFRKEGVDRLETGVLMMKNVSILHHLAKFQISCLTFRVILGNFQKLEQGKFQELKPNP